MHFTEQFWYEYVCLGVLVEVLIIAINNFISKQQFYFEVASKWIVYDILFENQDTSKIKGLFLMKCDF